MKLWRLIAIFLLFGALYEASEEPALPSVPSIRASSCASPTEEAWAELCDYIGQMPCELPLLRPRSGVEWGGPSRTLSIRPHKSVKVEGGVSARGSWSAAVAGSYHLAFFAEPRPVERLRVLRRLRI